MRTGKSKLVELNFVDYQEYSDYHIWVSGREGIDIGYYIKRNNIFDVFINVVLKAVKN
jgi:hypothetical protein